MHPKIKLTSYLWGPHRFQEKILPQNQTNLLCLQHRPVAPAERVFQYQVALAVVYCHRLPLDLAPANRKITKFQRKGRNQFFRKWSSHIHILWYLHTIILQRLWRFWQSQLFKALQQIQVSGQSNIWQWLHISSLFECEWHLRSNSNPVKVLN